MLEVTVPQPGAVGRGSLFLDDGESAAGTRFMLDAAVENLDGRLRVRLQRVADAFAPAQDDLELRVPAGYRCALVDGARRELVQRQLEHEDRQAVMQVVVIPLETREVVFEPA